MNTVQRFAPVTGRVLIAGLFVLAGVNKITGYAGTQGYMEAMGMSGGLLPLVIAFEIGAGLALAVGWQTRKAPCSNKRKYPRVRQNQWLCTGCPGLRHTRNKRPPTSVSPLKCSCRPGLFWAGSQKQLHPDHR